MKINVKKRESLLKRESVRVGKEDEYIHTNAQDYTDQRERIEVWRWWIVVVVVYRLVKIYKQGEKIDEFWKVQIELLLSM